MKQLAERYYPEDSSSAFYRRQGRVTTRIRGSHVDVNVRLYLWGQRLFRLLVAAVTVGVVFMVFRILEVVASGRVAQVLQTIQNAGR